MPPSPTIWPKCQCGGKALLILKCSWSLLASDSSQNIQIPRNGQIWKNPGVIYAKTPVAKGVCGMNYGIGLG